MLLNQTRKRTVFKSNIKINFKNLLYRYLTSEKRLIKEIYEKIVGKF
jgi:hypothetical protein